MKAMIGAIMALSLMLGLLSFAQSGAPRRLTDDMIRQAAWTRTDQQIRGLVPMPAAGVSYVIASENPRRIGIIFYNQSSNSAYITFGPTASSANPTMIIASFQHIAFMGPVVWTGQISAVRNAGAGATLGMVVTELISAY